jgi:hypothetical protein
MSKRAPLWAGMWVVAMCSTAHAEGDWFASLYTGDGVELRADERVFALYTVLNALGYDKAPVSRQNPIPKYAFHPVRQEVRLKVGALDPVVRKQADAFLDAHPQPLQRYLGYALALGPPPFDQPPKSKEWNELKGFDAVLRNAYGTWNLPELLAQEQGEYRKALRAYLPAIDGPMGKLRKMLRLGDDAAAGTLLVMNLLDAQGEVCGLRSEHGVTIVVGPSDKPNVEGVLREYARAFVEPAIGKKAQAGWPGGPGLLREAQLAGATEMAVSDYASALIARAAALKALDAPDAAYEAAENKGYFGLKEVARGFDDGRPLDAWALEALARAETRRPAKK